MIVCFSPGETKQDQRLCPTSPYFSFFSFFFFPYFSFCVCLYLWETKLKQSLCLTCLLVCLFLFLSLWTDKTKSNVVSHLFLIFFFPPYFSPCFPCLSFSLFFYVFLVCLSLSRGAETRFSLFLLLFCNQATSWNLFFFSFFLFSSWFSPSFFLKDQRQCPTFLSPVLHYQATSWNFARSPSFSTFLAEILFFKHGKLQTQNKIFPFLVKKVVTQVLKPLPTQAA